MYALSQLYHVFKSCLSLVINFESILPVIKSRDSSYQGNGIRTQRTQSHFFFSTLTTTSTMAAAIKAINAKIRSNKVLDYVCSTRMP